MEARRLLFPWVAPDSCFGSGVIQPSRDFLISVLKTSDISSPFPPHFTSHKATYPHCPQNSCFLSAISRNDLGFLMIMSVVRIIISSEFIHTSSWGYKNVCIQRCRSNNRPRTLFYAVLRRSHFHQSGNQVHRGCETATKTSSVRIVFRYHHAVQYTYWSIAKMLQHSIL